MAGTQQLTSSGDDDVGEEEEEDGGKDEGDISADVRKTLIRQKFLQHY